MEAETHRVFIGIKLKNTETINEITLFQSNFNKIKIVKLVKSINLHLTMKFLGDVTMKQLDDIKGSLTNFKIEPFNALLKGATAFPKVNYPRTLIITISEGSEELISIQKEIDVLLYQVGFAKEKRKFHPHLTIGRVKQKKGTGKAPIENIIQIINDNQDHLFGAFEVNEIALIESTLTPEGSIYKDLEVYPINH
ncbi:MAG: RNA 2',3'-cyclic phosphodiesterase [Candidatus Kariarchaeaceae archaeon]